MYMIYGRHHFSGLSAAVQYVSVILFSNFVIDVISCSGEISLHALIQHNIYKKKVSSNFNVDYLRRYRIWRWRYCLLFPLWYIVIPLKLSKDLSYS